LLGIQNRAFLHDLRVHGIAKNLSQLVWRIPCLETLLVDRHRLQRVQASPYRVLDRQQNSLIESKTVQRAYPCRPAAFCAALAPELAGLC
jgi:hypothetical protein